MIEIIILLISFIVLYLAVLTLSFLYLTESENKGNIKRHPSVTLVVPCHNEEENISICLKYILSLNYPKNLINTIVVDDKSTDSTSDIVESIIKKKPPIPIKLLHIEKGGKAKALNTVLEICATDLFAVIDADSIVEKDSLKNLVHQFSNKNTGAVITALRVYNPKNIYEKLQRIEYVIAVLIRRIMSALNTLHITPGVLSVYKTKVLKELKGFDDTNITEDFEIALRLKYYGYNIKLEPTSTTYTKVPNTFNLLWRQRIRWFRGFISNYISYKDMFFNKKYGLTGYYQLPVGVISVPLFLIIILFGIANLTSNLIEDTIRTFTIKGYFFESILEVPTWNTIMYGENLNIMIPLFFTTFIGIIIFIIAHRQIKEKIINPIAIILYFSAYPFLVGVHWICAISQEITRMRRKW